MWRSAVANALRLVTNSINVTRSIGYVGLNKSFYGVVESSKRFHTLTKFSSYPLEVNKLLMAPVLNSPEIQQSRNVTKFSLNKGKRKTVKTVLKRFKRLHWGAWIRTYTGRHKKMWKKSAARKRRLRQHVFVNSTQSWLLDKMVTSFWRRPKYWIDDPYEPYHRRDEFFATKGKTFKV